MVKKLFKLIQKYVCARVDLYQFQTQPLLPVFQFGTVHTWAYCGGVDIGWYVRWIPPLFRFGFEPSWNRKMDVAGWRTWELCLVKWTDAEYQVQWNSLMWEEDVYLTIEEEVRRLNQKPGPFVYYLDMHDGTPLIGSIFMNYTSNVENVNTSDFPDGALLYWDKDKGELCMASPVDPIVQVGIEKPFHRLSDAAHHAADALRDFSQAASKAGGPYEEEK